MNLTKVRVTAAQQVQIYDWVTKVHRQGYLWGQVVCARDNLLSARFGDYLVNVFKGRPETLELDCFSSKCSYEGLKAYVESHFEKQKLLVAA